MCENIEKIHVCDNIDNTSTVELNSFIGQKKFIDVLRVSAAAAKMRNEPLGHILLIGPIGSGKSTLANAIANEMNANIKVISFNAISKESELAAILTNVAEGDIILAENLDSLRNSCTDLLVSALDSLGFDFIIGKGPAARNIRLPLPGFTFIATMDRNCPISEKLKSCFFMKWQMEDYSIEELFELSKVHASKMNVDITDEAAKILVSKFNGSQRQLINVLKRTRDFALIKGNGVIDACIINDVISLIEL